MVVKLDSTNIRADSVNDFFRLLKEGLAVFWLFIWEV
jgi:hypothetical protein